MAVRLNKPWQTLDAESLNRVGGQLGVYELADQDGRVLYIGAATARSLQGLKGELQDRLGSAAQFRCEITSSYRTRQRELLMVHHADYGSYPEQNDAVETRGLGRLSP